MTLFLFLLERFLGLILVPLLVFVVLIPIGGRHIKKFFQRERNQALVYGLIGGGVHFWEWTQWRDGTEFAQAPLWVVVALGGFFTFVWWIFAYFCLLSDAKFRKKDDSRWNDPA